MLTTVGDCSFTKSVKSGRLLADNCIDTLMSNTNRIENDFLNASILILSNALVVLVVT
jgi:hypothetical protein